MTLHYISTYIQMCISTCSPTYIHIYIHTYMFALFARIPATTQTESAQLAFFSSATDGHGKCFARAAAGGGGVGVAVAGEVGVGVAPGAGEAGVTVAVFVGSITTHDVQFAIIQKHLGSGCFQTSHETQLAVLVLWAPRDSNIP